ncbi:MAG: aminopeptidase, partial [Spirochaetota bacterium]
MYSDDIAAYAELIVSLVNIDRGRNLQIRGEPVHWELMQEIAAAAYRRGARYVDTRAVHPGLLKARIEHSAEEYLDYVPSQLTAMNDIMISEEWAVVSIAGREDPDFLADVDDERNARIGKATEQAMMPFRRALQADRFPWIVVANPTEGWARKVLGAVPSPVETLWEAMRPILRLDRADPVAAWREHTERLKRRAAVLDEL